MTKDEIINMAREAGAKPGIENVADEAFLERFYALAVAKEREACAQLVEGASMRARFIRAGMNGEDIKPCTTAAAIRARGKQ